MVSAYLADALRDPTGELRQLYSKRDPPSADFAKTVADHFSRVFGADTALRQIPALDVQNPPSVHNDRSLVRFRAMVQDTSPSSEMYLQKSSNGSLGGWGIHEELDSASGHAIDYTDLRECTVMWAVSVPGESQWCSEEIDGHIERKEPSIVPMTRSHKYPEPEWSHIGVQIKMYDNDAAEKLKSTDIVTFVGILTQEPFDHTAEEPTEAPTLHVLYTQPHETSLLGREYPHPDHNITSVREELIEWISAESLGGDREAAEWILLTCIAKVESRNPPLLPLSMTLSHFPSAPEPSSLPDSGSAPPSPNLPALSHILSQITPLSKTLPLSLELLNKLPFAPESKDEDLHSGALQLPKGSVLLVTEGGVREGKLIERGLNNISILQEVMTSQSLSYIFPYSRFSFPTDISCVVMTEGKKSAFFKTDIAVSLQLSSRTPETISKLYKPKETISLPPTEKLAAFRDLVVGARQGKVRVNEATSEYIQQEFVRDRQQNQSVTSDDLIRRMTIAKLYALSLHEEELTIDAWERAKAFDERRKARLAAL